MSVLTRAAKGRGGEDSNAVMPNGKSPTPSLSAGKLGDKFYSGVIFVASLSIFIIMGAVAATLYFASHESIHTFGWHFFTSTAWNPVTSNFGALPFIEGTLYTSFWALVIAIPLSVGSAIFLSEIAPLWIRQPLSFMIELLAAVPSVVYGLWGIFIMAPWLVKHIETPISENATLSKMTLFSAPPNGNDLLAASLILAIMVIPYITAVSRDILTAIPRAVREGSYALGSTRWETIKNVVLPYARSGVVGGVMLGLGRALGETMAVTMVIGNNPDFHFSLFSPGYTMSSIIANEFSEASISVYRSALIEIGLTLFLVTMIVNACARLLVHYTARSIN